MTGYRCICSVPIALGILAISVSVFAHAWEAPAQAAARKNPVIRDEASIGRGKELYRIHCAECHGDNARGDGPKASRTWPRPPDLTQMAGHHADGDVAWKIENGRGDMPSFKKKLKQNQLWELVNFVQNLKP